MDYAAVYGRMHESRQKIFSGYSIRPHVAAIADLVIRRQARRLLDYGSGKGYQYLGERVHEAWGGILPVCYDPGVRQLRKRPAGPFDGIICTDVMEHIEEADVDRVLADIASLAADGAFIFFCIACRPAKRKRLPDGRDVHVTIRPPEWWRARLDRIRADVHVVFDEG
jgi:hypothetical protein